MGRGGDMPSNGARRAATGFSLVETLIAAAVIGVGLMGAAAGFLHAVGGLESSRQQTTAIFLAEERIEQLKARALNEFPEVTAANYPDEGYGSVSSNGSTVAGYRRRVTIVDAPGGLGAMKLVEVTVFYRPVVGFGVQAGERQVRVSLLLTDRS